MKIHFGHRQQEAFLVGSSAVMAAILVFALVGLVLFILLRGGSYFWPQQIYQIEYSDAANGQTTKVLANIDYLQQQDQQTIVWAHASESSHPARQQLRLEQNAILNTSLPDNAMEVVLKDGRRILALSQHLATPNQSLLALEYFASSYREVEQIEQAIEQIRIEQLAPIHQQLAEMNLRQVDPLAPARLKLNLAFEDWYSRVVELEQTLQGYVLAVEFADGQRTSLPLSEIKAPHQPNQFGWWQKMLYAVKQLGAFLIDSPKQANTAGGIFPALFGTVLMVLLMTIIVTPFGVLAAIYLSEYARTNWLTSLVRISVNNMAGVPSVVYGVFGLGFFVHSVGGNLDQLLFSEQLPEPTFGTPGLLWAALTMALLTLPVVIIATEEGLKRVPKELRLGSYALGATKAETIWHTILPIASPGIITGIILAIARAAGEVAPLMLVGAVMFAPSLPVDGEFPFVHLDRQFMHLGAFIYDGAFHSQNSSQGSSIVFASCSLLLALVMMLNIVATRTRYKLQQRLSSG